MNPECAPLYTGIGRFLGGRYIRSRLKELPKLRDKYWVRTYSERELSLDLDNEAGWRKFRERKHLINCIGHLESEVISPSGGTKRHITIFLWHPASTWTRIKLQRFFGSDIKCELLRFLRCVFFIEEPIFSLERID